MRDFFSNRSFLSIKRIEMHIIVFTEWKKVNCIKWMKSCKSALRYSIHPFSYAFILLHCPKWHILTPIQYPKTPPFKTPYSIPPETPLLPYSIPRGTMDHSPGDHGPGYSIGESIQGGSRLSSGKCRFQTRIESICKCLYDWHRHSPLNMRCNRPACALPLSNAIPPYRHAMATDFMESPAMRQDARITGIGFSTIAPDKVVPDALGTPGK